MSKGGESSTHLQDQENRSPQDAHASELCCHVTPTGKTGLFRDPFYVMRVSANGSGGIIC